MNKIMLCIMFLGISISAATLNVQDVIWTNPVYVSIDGNTLTGQTNNSWSAGAFSVQKIDAGIDGYFEMTALETNTYRMAGFSRTDVNSSYNSIEYALYLNQNSNLYIYESGSYIGNFGAYQSGDLVRVAREGTQIKYYHNNSHIYTSTKTTSEALYADSSLYTLNSTIYNAKISSVPEPSSLGVLLFSALLFFCFRKK